MDNEKFSVDQIMQDDAAMEPGAETVAESGDDAQRKPEPGWLKPRLQRERNTGYQQAKAEIEQQYAPLKELEASVKQLYPGKSLEDIVFDQRVKQAMEEDRGLSEKTAQRLVRAEMGMRPREAQQKPPQTNANLEVLKTQAAEIAEEYGENMAELLKANPDIMERVAEGDLDLFKARREIKAKSNPPTVRSPRGTEQAAKGFKEMSSTQLAEVNRRIANGETFK